MSPAVPGAGPRTCYELHRLYGSSIRSGEHSGLILLLLSAMGAVPRTCYEFHRLYGSSIRSGEFDVYPNGTHNSLTRVYCDHALDMSVAGSADRAAGWTVIASQGSVCNVASNS